MTNRLPPLNAARAFEAAARLGSFTRAAAELHVTPTAVSHQVKVLEASTGQILFRRQNNNVVLTAAGRLLASVLTDTFDRLALGMQEALGVGGSGQLSISVQPDFALKWLIPRLQRFTSLYPAMELRLVSAYRTLDLVAENIDVAIRYLDHNQVANGKVLAEMAGQLRVEYLLGADLVPVLSPALFPAGQMREPAMLRETTLLHISSALEDWGLWLAAAGVHGVNATQGPKFDSYTLSIEAAMQGWGVSLGRMGLIETDIAAGRLMVPFTTRLQGRRSWFIVTRLGAARPQVTAFRVFLLREAAAVASFGTRSVP